jgi:hypothetical protein
MAVIVAVKTPQTLDAVSETAGMAVTAYTVVVVVVFLWKMFLSPYAFSSRVRDYCGNVMWAQRVGFPIE